MSEQGPTKAGATSQLSDDITLTFDASKKGFDKNKLSIYDTASNSDD